MLHVACHSHSFVASYTSFEAHITQGLAALRKEGKVPRPRGRSGYRRRYTLTRAVIAVFVLRGFRYRPRQRSRGPSRYPHAHGVHAPTAGATTTPPSL
jgi:hypothetical protein